MSQPVTAAGLAGAFENLTQAAGRAGIVPPIGHSWNLTTGSKNAGVAFRVMFRDDVTGGLGNTPLFSGGLVGMTKAEAYERITTVTYALDGVRSALTTPDLVTMVATPVDGIPTDRVARGLQAAHDAFWSSVVASFPEVHGDLDPNAVDHIEQAMSGALASWLTNGA